MTDRVTVVVVNYDTRDDLGACLASVARAGEGAGPPPTVVADNPGYGGGANRAIAATATPYVLLLNSDTLLAPGALAALADHLDAHPEVGLAGPRLRNPDGSLQPSCYPFPGSLRWALDNDDLAPLAGRVPGWRATSYRSWAHDRVRAVPWVKGAALALRRTAFDAVGGFDEAFFMYHEESDLCYRLHAAGWAVHFAPVTDVVHTGGTSTARHADAMARALHRSAARFHAKHYAGAHRWLVDRAWAVLGRLRGLDR